VGTYRHRIQSNDSGTVDAVFYAPEEVTLKVQAPQNCWLFASERFAPGWKAYVDEKEVRIFKANFAFRAIEIPAGTHVVRMVYAPWLYKPLLILSWGLTAGILVAWSGVALWRRIPRRKGATGT